MKKGLSDYFAELYAREDDPYSLRTRWYEQRKRQVLLAALPQARYRCVYEPACGAAELTLHLAERCDELLASDFDARACKIARGRTAHLPHVRVENHELPRQWPVGARFDLVVLSEIGYFLSREKLENVASLAKATLTEDGTVVCCDWKPDFDRRRLSTDAVHEIVHDVLELPVLVRHEEADFLLQVWCRDGRSVAQGEGWA